MVRHCLDRGYEVVGVCRARSVSFALFMVAAITDDTLIHEAPAIVGRATASTRAHAESRSETEVSP